MTYLLDTCVISEAMKKRPDPDVMEWMRSVDEELMFISAVSIGEIRKGSASLGKTRRATFLLKWFLPLRQFLPQPLPACFSQREPWSLRRNRSLRSAEPGITQSREISSLSSFLLPPRRAG